MMKILMNKWTILIIRTLFGLNLFASGALVLFKIVALPPANPKADAFIEALVATGYEWPLIKITEIIAGILIVINRYTPLALLVIFPISVNIALFDTLLWPQGAPSGLFIILANVYLCFAYISYYRPLFNLKPTIA